jgi:hypothetical protein
MSARARWLCVPLLATALLAAPPASPASPLDIPSAVPKKFRALVRARVDAPKPRRSWESRFQIQTRQGYDLSVVAIEDIVGVIVRRHRPPGSARKRFRRQGEAVSMYVARGTVTTRRIEASFGGFGRIAVRFRPSGRVVKSPRRRHCRGAHRFTSRPGVFVGRVRFTGERGYVAVRAHRVKGRIRSPLRLRCSSRGPRRASAKRYARPVVNEPGFSFNVLQAGQREALAATEFLAFQVGAKVLYFAIAEESRGKMAVVRYAMAVAPSRSFAHNEALTAAKLDPPRPFAHAGHYVATPDGARAWGGNLSVAFPGTPRFPLAGPQFKVRLEVSY